MPAQKINISPSGKIPTQVLNACQKITDAGFKAWLAGGCVRDLALNLTPKDWDIVTNATFEKLKELFPKHLEVGAAFGILKLPPEDGVLIDLSIFRKDGQYKDFRHPEKIEIGDEKTDAARRDFTINALFYDIESNSVEDYVSGTKDLLSKTIRTVGNPNERFSEDALRILRALRLSAQLGFKIDKETAASLKKNAQLVRNVSRERIREEVFKILESKKPLLGIDGIAQNGLWETVFGVRRVSLPADLRQMRLTWVPTPIHWLCAFAVTGLFGDPQKEPEEMIERLTQHLRLSNAEKKVLLRVSKVYSECHKNAENQSTSPIEWIELAKSDKSLMDITKSFIRRARGPNEDEKQKAVLFIEQVLRWSTLNGSTNGTIELPGAPKSEELMKQGVAKGPALGKVLRQKQWEVFWAKKPGL